MFVATTLRRNKTDFVMSYDDEEYVEIKEYLPITVDGVSTYKSIVELEKTKVGDSIYIRYLANKQRHSVDTDELRRGLNKIVGNLNEVNTSIEEMNKILKHLTVD